MRDGRGLEPAFDLDNRVAVVLAEEAVALLGLLHVRDLAHNVLAFSEQVDHFGRLSTMHLPVVAQGGLDGRADLGASDIARLRLGLQQPFPAGFRAAHHESQDAYLGLVDDRQRQSLQVPWAMNALDTDHGKNLPVVCRSRPSTNDQCLQSLKGICSTVSPLAARRPASQWAMDVDSYIVGPGVFGDGAGDIGGHFRLGRRGNSCFPRAVLQGSTPPPASRQPEFGT